jgi:hypothetical protein
MLGRLGRFYLVRYLVEREAVHCADQPGGSAPTDHDLGIFLRLFFVIGIGFCAAGAVALISA